MNGRYPDGWGEAAKPAWALEPTSEWEPLFPGQRYPGDPGPLPPAHRRPTGRASVPTGRATVTQRSVGPEHPVDRDWHGRGDGAPAGVNGRSSGAAGTTSGEPWRAPRNGHRADDYGTQTPGSDGRRVDDHRTQRQPAGGRHPDGRVFSAKDRPRTEQGWEAEPDDWFGSPRSKHASERRVPGPDPVGFDPGQAERGRERARHAQWSPGPERMPPGVEPTSPAAGPRDAMSRRRWIGPDLPPPARAPQPPPGPDRRTGWHAADDVPEDHRGLPGRRPAARAGGPASPRWLDGDDLPPRRDHPGHLAGYPPSERAPIDRQFGDRQSGNRRPEDRLDRWPEDRPDRQPEDRLDDRRPEWGRLHGGPSAPGEPWRTPGPQPTWAAEAGAASSRHDAPAGRRDPGREGTTGGRFLDPEDDLTRRPVPRMPMDPHGRPGRPGPGEPRLPEPERMERPEAGSYPDRPSAGRPDEDSKDTPRVSAWLTPARPANQAPRFRPPDETDEAPSRQEPLSPAARRRLEYLPADTDGAATGRATDDLFGTGASRSDLAETGLDKADLGAPDLVGTATAGSAGTDVADTGRAGDDRPDVDRVGTDRIDTDRIDTDVASTDLADAEPADVETTTTEAAPVTATTTTEADSDRPAEPGFDISSSPDVTMPMPADAPAPATDTAALSESAAPSLEAPPLIPDEPLTKQSPFAERSAGMEPSSLDEQASLFEPAAPQPTAEAHIEPTSAPPAADAATGTLDQPSALPEIGPIDDAASSAVPVTSAPPAPGAADPIEPVVSGPPAVTPESPVAASPDTVLPAPDGPVAGAATALRAPTMLTPIVQQEATDEAEPPETTPAAEPEPQPDPEQVLASYKWRFHHETLRELVEDPDELRTIRDRLTEKLESATDNGTRARLLSLRAVVSRILGDLGKALADGKLALEHAEATGELRRIAIAQARLAHVLQWRGDFAEADRLFEEANSSELPDRLRATMHEHAGRSCYDQGRYIEACNHFERALELRKVEDPELIARTELALDAVYNKVAQNGWGPYPRTREEILQIHRPPTPAFSEEVQRWGYAHADGKLAVAPSYADVQPFRDGVAWVRRPETRTWELIDETGKILVDSSAGYIGVGSFSDGLAWVSRDGTGGWVAIDKSNRLVIPIGFDDVRPFRRGIAAVRRGNGWGAVDKTGRLVVPPKYTAFTTALTDGRYLDGFTDEGLAIVDSNGRKGVVDRTGRVIVPPSHPVLVIHPVAFLIGNGNGQWGALDRRGEPLIDVIHPSRTDVMDEIDRLLADTKPVL